MHAHKNRAEAPISFRLLAAVRVYVMLVYNKPTMPGLFSYAICKKRGRLLFRACRAVRGCWIFDLPLSVYVFRGGGQHAFDVFHVHVADVADAEGVGFGDFPGVEDVAFGFHEFIEVFEVEGFVWI